MKKCLALLLLAASSCLPVSAVRGQEPGWSPAVIAFGARRAEIKAMPIIYRKYRPFHFYGNTVRRRYYRGTILPAPRDLVQASASTVRLGS